MGFIDDDAWQEQNKARRATANLAVVAKEREKFATGKEVAALRKRIRVLIDNADGKLRAGMTGELVHGK